MVLVTVGILNVFVPADEHGSLGATGHFMNRYIFSSEEPLLHNDVLEM